MNITPSQGTYDSNEGIWDVGDIAKNSTATLIIDGTLNTTGTHKKNTAEVVESKSYDPDSTPNNHDANEDDQDSVTINVQASADLLSVKIDDTDPVVAGNTLTYTITITNNGPDTAENVTLIESFPSELQDTKYYSLDNGATWIQFTANSSLILNLGSLSSGAFKTILIKGTVKPSTPEGTVISNTATVTTTTHDPNQNNNTDTEETTVTTQADISVTKTILNPTTYIEDDITYHIEVTNNGPSYAQNVEVTDLLPSGLVYKSYTASQGTYDSNTGIWSIGTLANGSTVTLDITVRIEDYNPITNTATVTSDTTDPAPGNNTSSVTIDVEDPLIKGTVPRVGYFEFFVRTDTNMWKIRVPGKGYDTGWMPFDRLNNTGSFMSGHYADRRYHLLFDWYSSGRCHLAFNDRRAGISIKFAGR